MYEDLIGPRKKKGGRPAPRPKDGTLHALLVRIFPPTIVETSKALGIDYQIVRYWIIHNRIPPLRAAEIVDVCEGRATLADFFPFIFLDGKPKKRHRL